MAFPIGWARKCALTIDKTKVPANQTDFPALFNLSNLPPEMFDADGSYPARSDGGDVRFSSDALGATPLCVEVVSFTINNNPALGAAEIWVKVPAVSTSVNTVVYVWYNNPSATMPADNSTYGAENVWSNNFRAVYHMNDATLSTVKDSTSSHNTGTKSANKTTETAGPFAGGKGQDFVQATNTNIDCGNTTASDVPVHFTMSSYLKLDNSGYQSIWGKGQNSFSGQDWTIQDKGSGFRLMVNDNQSDESGSSISTGNWYYVHLTYDGANKRVYKNGAEDTAYGSPWAFVAGSVNDTAGSKLNFGRCHADQNFDGIMDEIRVAGVTRSSTWITTEYNSISSPSTFVSVGSPGPGSAGNKGLMAFFGTL